MKPFRTIWGPIALALLVSASMIYTAAQTNARKPSVVRTADGSITNNYETNANDAGQQPQPGFDPHVRYEIIQRAKTAAQIEATFQRQRSNALATATASINPMTARTAAVIGPAQPTNYETLWYAGSWRAFRYGTNDPRNKPTNLPLWLQTSTNLVNWTNGVLLQPSAASNITVASPQPARYFRLINQ